MQFIGGKYVVLLNDDGFIQLNLYTHKIVTGKTFPERANHGYSLIKSKKNGNYYVMTIAGMYGEIMRFFKLRTD